ncbi:MAG: DUF2304 domain-containing protein [Candidatus Competibacterales bacterium]
MISYQLTSAVIGLAVAGGILYLVRRDHMYGRYALWWLAGAALVVVVGAFPALVDYIASLAGVSYPPILAVTLALGLGLIKMLTMDLARSRQERALRRLAQRLAILEARLEAQPPPSEGQSSGVTRGTLPD